jgi:mono/diheme cytochrome c family protein
MKNSFPLLKALVAAFCCAAGLPARAQTPQERGRYLAILGDCAGCHSVAHKPAYSGGLPFTVAFGTLYSTNITPDKLTGIGNWTEDQFYRALHEGIAADGSHLYPAFPYIYFTHISRADTGALFAYIKTLKPIRMAPTPNKLIFPFNIRAVMIVWNWLFLNNMPYVPDPHRSAAWNRGDYIVNGLGHCAACHTPKNIMFGDESSRALTGTVLNNWFAANLTGDDRAGLGKWTHSELVKYFTIGQNRYATAAGTMQEKVTLSTSRMSDADRDAIATYLKSLPPKAMDSPGTANTAQMQRGEAIFQASCSVCHQPSGIPDQPQSGELPPYPKLAGDTLVLGRDPTTVLRILLDGAQSSVTSHAATGFSMPSFVALSNSQLADVATYIRNFQGNRAPPVTASDVKELRHAIATTPEGQVASQ